MDVDEEEEDEEPEKINLANAVHLSDSEEEEELEDIIDDFATAMNMETARTPCAPMNRIIDMSSSIGRVYQARTTIFLPVSSAVAKIYGQVFEYTTGC